MVAKEIFVAVSERLAPIKDWLNIDLFNNQFTQEANENPLQVPCVLVEFATINWQQQGFGLMGVPQIGELQVTLHIASDLYENTYAGSTEQANAIKFFDFVEAITSAIQGLFGGSFSPMVRVTTQYPSEFTNVHLSKVTFQTVVTQTIDSTNYLEALADLRIFKTAYPYPTNE